MKRSAIAFALVILSSASALSRQRQQPPRLEDAVVDFYVGEFQRVVIASPDVFVKARPLIREFIQARFDISARRQETLQQLRMMLNRQKGSDEDIKPLIRELDKADADIQANQDHFLSSIDPLLSVRQQGRVRVFQQVADQAMRQMLNKIRNGRSSTNQPPTPSPNQ